MIPTRRAGRPGALASAVVDVSHLFPGAAAGPYFGTASVCLGSRPALETLATQAAAWADGTFDWTEAERAGEACRELFADLLGTDPAQVALTNSASAGANIVAAQLPQAADGANVVVPAFEFTSNFFPWQRLSDRGYELRHVTPSNGWLTLDDFADAVDRRTALVAASAVQSSTGQRLDLNALGTMAHDVGARLVVDASQAAGAVDLREELSAVDALFSCDHKFLLGMRGLGYLWVRHDWLDAFEPAFVGWKASAEPLTVFYGPDMNLSETASRLDLSLAWHVAHADRVGLGILESVGIARIEAHNAELIAQLRDRLATVGVAAAPAPGPIGPIVSVPLPIDEALLAAELAADRITATFRAGRLRLAVHLYNTVDDLDRLLGALERARG